MTTRLLGSLGVWLLLTVAVSADPLRLPSAVFFAAASADNLTSARLFAQCAGCSEVNPMWQWADDRPALFLAVTTAGDVAGMWAWNRYVGRRHPRLARLGLYAAAGLRTWLTVSTVRLSRRVRTP